MAAMVASLMAADTHGLLSAGEGLSDADAAALEQSLAVKPDNRDARVKLLGYWGRKPHPEIGAVVAARARHILWFIRESPRDDVFHTTCGPIYLGGSLADRATFDAGRALWLGQVEKNPGDKVLDAAAAGWLALGAPEDAERLYREAGDSRGLAWLYAEWILGIAAEDCKTSDPMVAEDSRRNSAFAQKTRSLLAATNDPELLATTARFIEQKGHVLYSSHKIDWDYDEYQESLVARAHKLDPDLVPLPGELPKSIRIHANANATTLKVLYQPGPVYPVFARQRGIAGVVELRVFVGKNGSVVKAEVMSGPVELRDAALAAVQKWRYRPMTVNGIPVEALTRVLVTFQLGER
jgi:TonB family protein